MAPVRQPQAAKARVEPLPSASLTTFLKKEDELATSIPRQKFVDDFRALADAIRSEIASGKSNPQNWDDAARRDKLLIGAIQMRRLNRLSNYHLKHLRERTSAARGLLDSQFLSLQNVQSEIVHLNKTIENCLEFRSGDDDMELVSVDDFYKNAPESISKPEQTRSDPHEQHLARLNYELHERKNLLNTLHELDGRKQVLLSDIRGKESRLGQIRPRITSLKEAAKPLLDILGLKSVSSTSAEMVKRTAYLSKELQLLYVNASVYNDLFEEDPIEILCEGDTTVATKNRQEKNQPEEESDEEADTEEQKASPTSYEAEAEDGDRKKHRKHRNRRQENDINEKLQRKRDRLLAADPISVSLVVSKSGVKLKVTFVYLTEMKCIGVKCHVEGDVTNWPLLDPDSVLDELFEDDTGDRCPTPNSDALMKLMDLKISTYASIIGKLYHFAQVLCGLAVTDNANAVAASAASTSTANSSQQQFEAFVDVLSRIRARLATRTVLSKRLAGLESLKTQNMLPSSLQRFVPQKIVSRIASMKPISLESFLSTQVSSDVHTKLLSSPSALERGFHFHIRLERADFVLGALAQISPDYPCRSPVFMLTIRSVKHQSSAAYVTAIKALEQYVNTCVPQLLQMEEANELFSLQVAALVSRMDVALEVTSRQLGNKEFELEHVYRSFASGFSQRFPFEFEANTNSYGFSTTL